MGIVADRMIESDRTQPLTLDIQFGKLSLSSLFGTPLSSARARSYSDETPQAVEMALVLQVSFEV